MEEITPSPTQERDFDESKCSNCQIHIFEPGYPINLCSNCRKELINYPIPKWIKIFAIILAGVIVISIVRTQLYVSAAINLGKSEKAIENGAYVTAQTELVKVLNKFPDDVNANANMIIASAYNLDLNSLNISYERIKSKKIEDEELFAKVDAALLYVGENLQHDSLSNKKVDEIGSNKEKLMQFYHQFKQDSLESAIKIKIANILFDMKEYTAAEEISLDILKTQPNFFSALSLMSAIKRDTGKFDEALTFCDRILKTNSEDVYSLGQKTRIELKRKHDQQAAVYAKQAMMISPANDSSLEAMAMVDYFAGRKKEAIASLSIINSHLVMGDSTISKRLTEIINGKNKYR